MFVGHLGAGLAAKRLAPEVGLGVLFLAAMGLDALLWIFVLLGLESVHFPVSVGEARYPTFTFPYSHGLVASLAWSAIAVALVRVAGRSLGAALVVAATVFSHFVLDVLVHVAGLPLLGDASYHLGLGLWRHTRPRARRRVRARWRRLVALLRHAGLGGRCASVGARARWWPSRRC